MLVFFNSTRELVRSPERRRQARTYMPLRACGISCKLRGRRPKSIHRQLQWSISSYGVVWDCSIISIVEQIHRKLEFVKYLFRCSHNFIFFSLEGSAWSWNRLAKKTWSKPKYPRIHVIVVGFWSWLPLGGLSVPNPIWKSAPITMKKILNHRSDRTQLS
jgi:hypothetical protein